MALLDPAANLEGFGVALHEDSGLGPSGDERLVRYPHRRIAFLLRVADEQASFRIQQRVDQAALRRSRWESAERNPSRDRALDAAFPNTHLHEREQHGPERL